MIIVVILLVIFKSSSSLTIEHSKSPSRHRQQEISKLILVWPLSFCKSLLFVLNSVTILAKLSEVYTITGAAWFHYYLNKALLCEVAKNKANRDLKFEQLGLFWFWSCCQHQPRSEWGRSALSFPGTSHRTVANMAFLLCRHSSVTWSSRYECRQGIWILPSAVNQLKLTAL